MDPLGALFSGSWRLFKERFWVLAEIILIPVGLMVLAQLVRFTGQAAGVVVGGILSLAGGIGLVLAALALIASVAKKTSVGDSYGVAFKLFWAAVWLAVLEVFVMAGGFMLLIVPGFFLAIALSFGRFALVLEGKRGMAALAESREYVRGRWWAVFGRVMLLGFAIWVLAAAALTLLIGAFGAAAALIIYWVFMIAVVPFAICYSYTMYENLRRLAPNAAEDAARKSPTFLKVCFGIGIAGLVLLVVAAIAGIVFFIKSAGNGAFSPNVPGPDGAWPAAQQPYSY